MNVCGILNLNKPAGLTSRDAVDRAQRLLRPAKCGHAGTLDPLATGVLVVCVGPATRLIQYVQRMEKRYRATFLLGRRSLSEDIEGDVEILADQREPTEDELLAAMRQFVGQIEQRPPAHSAIKVAGQRAYKLARRGEAVELAARPVTIHALELVWYEYPELVVDIRCGSGTYVRSLGRDLAKSLGTAAVMAALERAAIGGFRIEASVPVDVLREENWRQHLQPALAAVADLPRVAVDVAALAALRHGRPIDMPGATTGAAEGTGATVEAVDAAGKAAGAVSEAMETRVAAEANVESTEATEAAESASTATELSEPAGDAEPTAGEWAAIDEAGQLVAILHEKRPGELWPRYNLM